MRRRPTQGRYSLLDFTPDAVRLRAEGPRPHRPTLEYRLTFIDAHGETLLTEYKETSTAATFTAKYALKRDRASADRTFNPAIARCVAVVVERCTATLEDYQDVTAETYGDPGAIVAAGFTPTGAE